MFLSATCAFPLSPLLHLALEFSLLSTRRFQRVPNVETLFLFTSEPFQLSQLGRQYLYVYIYIGF